MAAWIEFTAMHLAALTMLLVLVAPLAGCARSLDRGDVGEFIDQANEAARKRFAPGICELRGKDFKLQLKFQGHEPRFPPTEIQIDRPLFCKQAGSFARVRQYQLERKSIDIHVAPDGRTARVIAEYVETLPYYEPDRRPSTPDDFTHFQILQTRDESVVGIESGEMVFLSTRADSQQALVGKSHISLPYD